jgi:hypothetical protein
MAARTRTASPESAEMTIHSESSQVPTEPRKSTSITRRRKETSAPTVANQNQGNAILTEELVLAFDPELRAAILTRLVREKGTIQQLATQEEQLSYVLEVAKLSAVEAGHAAGIANARREKAEKEQKLRDAEQKNFIENDLPQLLDSCDYLPYEAMKKTVEGFAKLVGLKLQWEETGDGEYTCTASPI